MRCKAGPFPPPPQGQAGGQLRGGICPETAAARPGPRALTSGQRGGGGGSRAWSGGRSVPASEAPAPPRPAQPLPAAGGAALPPPPRSRDCWAWGPPAPRALTADSLGAGKAPTKLSLGLEKGPCAPKLAKNSFCSSCSVGLIKDHHRFCLPRAPIRPRARGRAGSLGHRGVLGEPLCP